jgi:hypothetical protein
MQFHDPQSLGYKHNFDGNNNIAAIPSNISYSFNQNQNNRSIQNKIKLVASRDFLNEQT